MISEIKFILLLAAFVQNAESSNNKTHGRDVVKRDLRWNTNKEIVSNINTLRNLRIDYLKSHDGSVPVTDTNSVYMAFTLYRRNGDWIVPNTGVFHFLDLKTADTLRHHCDRRTRHAGAYYHFYGRCPEEETRLVASGWCLQGSKGLVFRSTTFNSARFDYLDGQYYLGSGNDANPYEITLLKYCYNMWKTSGFVVNWKCPTNDVPLTAGVASGAREKRSNDGCCDCYTSRGPHSFESQAQKLWILFCMILFAVVVFLRN